jgi:hypothetical protein
VFLYTTSVQERDSALLNGWTAGSPSPILTYVSQTQLSGTAPLYRLYNASNGDRIYTKSTTERSSLMSAGWQSEGTCCYVW